MISKKILNALTKEQLIFLINQYQHMEFLISEVCVNESKQHIPSEQAIEEIRKELKFTSLRYHRLDDMIESVGIDKSKLCTYCWDGRE